MLFVWVELSYVGFEGLIDLHVASHYKVAEHNVHKEHAKRLTVKSVDPASMAWKHSTKVFYIVGSFQSGGEKSSERSDQRSE